MRHISQGTRHTSHVTRHTSHVTRHASHDTCHTSHVTSFIVTASAPIPSKIDFGEGQEGGGGVMRRAIAMPEK